MPDIANKIKLIISENLDVTQEKVEDQAKFVEDLEADSLDIVELVMAFEEQYDIEIPDKDVKELTMVSEAIAYIEKSLQHRTMKS